MTTISFSTSSPDKLAYENFIVKIRDTVAKDEVHGPHGFKVLRNPKLVKDTERFIFVNLTNRAKQSIMFAVDVTNLYIVAYRSHNASYYFEEYRKTCPYHVIFTDTTKQFFPFGGRYVGSKQLQENAKAERTVPASTGGTVKLKGREAIELGIDAFDRAIGVLSMINPLQEPGKAAQSLIVAIQMVAEAVRFKQIEQEVKDSIDETVDPKSKTFVKSKIITYKPFWPSPLAITLENGWDPLSKQIQNAKDSEFKTPVKLDPQTGYSDQAFSLDRIDSYKLFSYVAVIKYEEQEKASQKGKGKGKGKGKDTSSKSKPTRVAMASTY